MFIILLGQHVSILIESSSGPSKKTDPMFKMRCGTPNAYNLDILPRPGQAHRVLTPEANTAVEAIVKNS